MWTGFLLAGFFASFPRGKIDRRVYLFIGLTCVSFSCYLLASGLLFATSNAQLLYYAGLVKFATAIPLSLSLFLLSASYLKLKNFYWWRVIPLWAAVYFILFLIFPGKMVSPEGKIYSLELFGYGFSQYIPQAKELLASYLLVSVLNGVVILALWIRHYIKSKEDFWLMVCFLLLVVFGFWEVGHDLGYVSILSPFNFITAILLILVSFRLFQNVMKINQEFWRKSQELKKINEEMKFLISTISHDIMGPLVAIHGFTDLMEEEKLKEILLPEKRDHYLERVRVNVDHMKSLLNDLADYVRIGRVEEEMEQIDFPALINQTIAMMDNLRDYPDAKIEITGQWPREFYAPSLRLKQIFTNLIQNALRYAKRRDVHVQIRGELKLDQFVFYVQDNGPGIPEPLQNKVFDVFFRNDRGVPGTGMGLPIVRKIVETLQGKIWVEPEYKSGASVAVSFPYPH